MNLKTRQALVGFAIIPLLLSFVMSSFALGDPFFAVLMVINAVIAYPLFIGLVYLYDFCSKQLSLMQSWRQLGFVAFVVVFAGQACLHYLNFHAYSDYTSGFTQIVKEGEFTDAGIRLLLKHALGVALAYSVGMIGFWLIQKSENRVNS
jgi:ABC-type Na+ efflux pump permease subunit